MVHLIVKLLTQAFQHVDLLAPRAVHGDALLPKLVIQGLDEPVHELVQLLLGLFDLRLKGLVESRELVLLPFSAIVEFQNLFYQIVDLPATHKLGQPSLGGLLLLVKEFIIFLDHLVIGKAAADTWRVEGLLEHSYQVCLIHLSRAGCRLHVFGVHCRICLGYYLLQVEHWVHQVLEITLDLANERAKVIILE